MLHLIPVKNSRKVSICHCSLQNSAHIYPQSVNSEEDSKGAIWGRATVEIELHKSSFIIYLCRHNFAFIRPCLKLTKCKEGNVCRYFI